MYFDSYTEQLLLKCIVIPKGYSTVLMTGPKCLMIPKLYCSYIG